MTILYHEKQESALCGQHCLNNLLQGPYYNAGTLADLAHELDRKETALMMTEGGTACRKEGHQALAGMAPSRRHQRIGCPGLHLGAGSHVRDSLVPGSGRSAC